MRRVQIAWFVSALTMVTMFSPFVDATAGDNARSANRKAVVRSLINFAMCAQDYYRRPNAQGGGQGSFLGITANAVGLGKLSPRPYTPDGIFTIAVAGSPTSVTLQGIGTEIGNDGYFIKVTAIVFADSMAFAFAN